MQLFERVKAVAEQLAPSQTSLGKALGLTQSKFNQYLNAVSEKNLWQYLPRILEIYPQVSREWLYFGEGEMIAAQGHGLQTVARPLRAVSHMAGAQSDDSTTDMEREIAELRTQVNDLRGHIATQNELLAVYKERAEGRFPHSGDMDAPAPITPGAAHSVRQDNKRT